MPIVPVGFNRKTTVGDCPDQLQAMGPTLTIYVGFDPNSDGKNSAVTPAIPPINKLALIDTGASHNSIDTKLAKELQLPIVDKRPISGVHGSQEVEICSAQIHLPHFNFTMYGTFALVRLREGGQPHDALLGRNLLRHFILQYDGVVGYARLMR